MLLNIYPLSYFLTPSPSPSLTHSPTHTLTRSLTPWLCRPLKNLVLLYDRCPFLQLASIISFYNINSLLRSHPTPHVEDQWLPILWPLPFNLSSIGELNKEFNLPLTQLCRWTVHSYFFTILRYYSPVERR
jgi:hypothetical protein